MQKYKVQFKMIQTYVIDVLADTEQEAFVLGKKHLDESMESNMEHYYQTGDTEIELDQVFDVTHTDDSFDPFNEKLSDNNIKPE